MTKATLICFYFNTHSSPSQVEWSMEEFYAKLPPGLLVQSKPNKNTLKKFFITGARATSRGQGQMQEQVQDVDFIIQKLMSDIQSVSNPILVGLREQLGDFLDQINDCAIFDSALRLLNQTPIYCLTKGRVRSVGRPIGSLGKSLCVSGALSVLETYLYGFQTRQYCQPIDILETIKSDSEFFHWWSQNWYCEM
jgi:hypothetical protein